MRRPGQPRLNPPDPDCITCSGVGFELLEGRGAKICGCRLTEHHKRQAKTRTATDRLEELADALERQVGG